MLLAGWRISFEKPVETQKNLDPGLGDIRNAEVLLAEDNEINQQVAQEILQNAGLRVSIVPDGQQAVRAVREKDYDAVLMDIQMPVMDGYAATLAIREEYGPEELPIIAMTANAMAGDRNKAMQTGMNDHVAKPIDMAELYAVLLKWIKPGPRKDPRPEPGPQSQPDPEAELPYLQGLDTEVGLARVAGNRKLYRSILVKFVQNQAGAAKEIQAALEQGQMELAERIAHTAKGVSGNIAAESLHRAAANLDNALKEGDLDRAAELLPVFALELKMVISSITVLQDSEQHPGKKETEFDSSQAESLLSELEKLLEDDNASASSPLEQLSSMLRDTAHATLLERLNQHVGGYEFEEALDALHELRKDMETNVEA